MVRKCIEQDRKHIKEYLKQEAEYNTYILADIDDFGFDSEFQTVYVDEENDSIKGVYLCFYQNLIMYSKDNDINTEFLRELFTEYTPDVVMGKLENVNLATELLPDYNIKAQRLYFLNDPANLENDENDIEKAQPGEAGEIFDFIQTIPEIRNLYTSKQMIIDRLEKNAGIHYLIRRGGKIVSHANSAAGSEYTTMIGGVSTDAEFRGKKMASRIVSRLCRDIMAEGKRPCLFAADREKHNFYTRIGFERAGQWGIMVRG